MHKDSFEAMRRFVYKYLDPDGNIRILDVGSLNVNGFYKPLFDTPNWEYIGCDAEDGKNVDVVLKDPYKWEFKDEEFDVVISGQTLEHVEFFWLTLKEMDRVLKKGGRCCIVVPRIIQEHRFPVDCYRFYPDGMRALAKWVNWDVLAIETVECDYCRDTILIARKP